MTIERIEIGCAADGAYALPLSVMLRSLEKNLAQDARARVWIIDAGLTATDRLRIAASASSLELIWLSPRRSRFEKLPIWGRIPVSTYDKLTLIGQLPETVERILWLDGDVLVLSDIAQLFHQERAPCTVLAVRDRLVGKVSSPFGVQAANQLGLAADEPYFNAGVLSIDCHAWRSERVEERAFDYIEKFANLVFFWDQEALNAVLVGRWRELDETWNYNAGLDAGRLARKLWQGQAGLPAILHFSGASKPWSRQCSPIYQELFAGYARETPWASDLAAMNLSNPLFDFYERSGLRRWCGPLEHLRMRLQYRWTRRYVTSPTEGHS